MECQSAIRLQNVRKEFQGKTAVKELSLSIPTGEIYGFLGPNGAGKTTTIKMLAGLMTPTSGDLWVRDINVQEDSLEARKRLAYVPDQPYLYDKLSGREFLEFVGGVYQMDETYINEQIEYYEDLFEMGEYLDNLGESYSHGMKQRVVLSATFMHDPEVILVDEPLVGLDPESSRLVRKLFQNEAEQGNTIFMSTHVLSIAEDVADRIGVINEGTLLAEGTMDELREYVGSRNAGLEELFMNITDTSGEVDPEQSEG